MKEISTQEIQERHDVTLLIDWEKEFNPEAQPQSLTNALLCHTDRGILLKRLEKYEKMTGFTGSIDLLMDENIGLLKRLEAAEQRLELIETTDGYAPYVKTEQKLKDIAELPDKWRSSASQTYYRQGQRDCADELQAILEDK